MNYYLLGVLLISCVCGDVVFKNDEYETGSRNSSSANGDGTSQGRNLLNWISSFTDTDTDPYLAKANSACLEGDLSECFKAKALSSFDDFFAKSSYAFSDNAKIVRMPEEHVRSVYREPYEFSSTTRADEPEWDQFVKFLTRKVERFLKSTAFEVDLSEDVTENGRYAPRFIDEISSELDAIEDKKASVFSKYLFLFSHLRICCFNFLSYFHLPQNAF